MDGLIIAKLAVMAATKEKWEGAGHFQDMGNTHECTIHTSSGRQLTVRVNIHTGGGIIFETGHEPTRFSTKIIFE